MHTHADDTHTHTHARTHAHTHTHTHTHTQASPFMSCIFFQFLYVRVHYPTAFHFQLVIQIKPLPIRPARIHQLIPALVHRLLSSLTLAPLLPITLPPVSSKALLFPQSRDLPIILNRNLLLIPAPQNRHVTEKVFPCLPTLPLRLLQSRRFPLIPC